MEVHKHPHHVTHQKKWAEYVLEFFMLFLAVFLGFIAENIRESIADHQKEKEYIRSLVEDLKVDTATFTRECTFNTLLIKGEDSVLNLLSADLHNRDSAELAMIYFFKYGIYTSFATITDRTITQLKNNGSMRLIRNQAVSDKIISYYNYQAKLSSQATDVGAFLNSNDKEANAIFNIKANRVLLDSFVTSNAFGPSTNVDLARRLLTRRGPTLLTEDPKTIATFMAAIEYHRGLMATYRSMLMTQSDKAVKLIQLINEQYHLAD
jgi:hypothetical protein